MINKKKVAHCCGDFGKKDAANFYANWIPISANEQGKVINELICQTEPRNGAFALSASRRNDRSASLDLDKVDSFSCDFVAFDRPVVMFQIKHARRGFPNEVPAGPVLVDGSGIAGGHPPKRPPNFGPDRVVYAYAARHYPKWRAEFPSLADAFHAGAFGESFTLTGADEESACIGDIIRVGSCHLQVSEPGQPTNGYIRVYV